MDPNPTAGDFTASMDVECGDQYIHNASISEEQRVPDGSVDAVPAPTYHVTSGVSDTGHVRWDIAMHVYGDIDRTPVAVSPVFRASPTGLRKKPSLCVIQRQSSIQLSRDPAELVEPPRSPSPHLPPAPSPSPVGHTHEVDGPLGSGWSLPPPVQEPDEGIDQPLSTHSKGRRRRYVKCARLIAGFPAKVIHQLSLACTRALGARKHSNCRACPIVIMVTHEIQYTL